ncbi:MAG: nucleotide exchange factor GrpE, partial [Longimicrobiales bacterium]|nr:nucleotide exchange factor GrpE [Longimicrobiales bacterium]
NLKEDMARKKDMKRDDLMAQEGRVPDGDPEAGAGPEEDPKVEADSEIDSPAEVDSGVGEDLQAELVGVQDDLRRLRDQHLRLAADFENYRKRASADLAGVWLRAQAELVRSLVEGLDDLQRVSRFTSEDTTVDALIEGVDLVERNLLKALTEAGLKVLNPEGERFDPNSMEAMMRVATEEDGQDETVHQVFQKGYMFKDQLVRPARVSVYMDED